MLNLSKRVLIKTVVIRLPVMAHPAYLTRTPGSAIVTRYFTDRFNAILVSSHNHGGNQLPIF